MSKAVEKRLFEWQDLKYRDFQCRLMPTVDRERVIGVRTPALRKLAKELSGTPLAEAFLRELPHRYFEENNLHAFLLENIKDFDAALAGVETFLPCVDNWATCDQLVPKALKKNLPLLADRIRVWAASEHSYTVRFAVGMLLRFYLDEAFEAWQPELVLSTVCQDYYINMMAAWYFATAMAKQPEAILPYFSEKRLPVWTHNKAIQKCVESHRIPEDTKILLRTMRIK